MLVVKELTYYGQYIADATLVTVAELVDTTITISISDVLPVDSTVVNAGINQSDLFANILN